MCSLLSRLNTFDTCDISGILLTLLNLSHISDIPALSNSPRMCARGEARGCYACTRPSLISEEGGEETFTNVPNLPMGEGGQTSMFLSTLNSVIGDGGVRGVADLAHPNSPSLGEERIEDPKTTLSKLKTKNMDRVVMGHLNINHLDKKFVPLVSLIKNNLDIFLISETKIDGSFPQSQFKIEGYAEPFRKDRDRFGGGLLMYVRDDIPCKQIKLKYNLPPDIESLFVEINLRNKKKIF